MFAGSSANHFVGKGGSEEQSWSNTAAGLQHHSTPLSALRDPSEFGPPPKRTPGGTGSPRPGSSSSSAPVASAEPTHPDQEPSYAVQRSPEESEEERPPPVPRRVQVTGPSKASPPVPPPHRHGRDSAAQAEPDGTIEAMQLPPRLPLRDSGAATPASRPPTYEPVHQTSGMSLNQAPIERLAKAGVSIPGLRTGGRASPSLPPRPASGSPARPATPSSPGLLQRSATGSLRRPATPATPPQSQLSELEERFARMRANSVENGGSSGAVWAQKRAALDTTSSIKKDQPSDSTQEHHIAVSTASGFPDRHAEQVASGIRLASAISHKLGSPEHAVSTSSSTSQPSTSLTSPPPIAEAARKKKPPPPPPPKKKKKE